jgi:hypothetical protein
MDVSWRRELEQRLEAYLCHEKKLCGLDKEDCAFAMRISSASCSSGPRNVYLRAQEARYTQDQCWKHKNDLKRFEGGYMRVIVMWKDQPSKMYLFTGITNCSVTDSYTQAACITLYDDVNMA